MSIPWPSTAEFFDRFVGEKFTLHAPDGQTAELTMESVNRRFDDEVQRAFSLYFRGPVILPTHQTCRLTHPELGDFELSLGPVRNGRAGVVYEAGFSFLKDWEKNPTIPTQPSLT